MYILEGLMFIIGFLMIGILMIKRSVKVNTIVALLGLLGLVFIVHLSFGNIRWQLYPLYGALVFLTVNVFERYFKFTIRYKIIRKSFFIISVVFMVVSGLSLVIFPVYDLPTPNGMCEIGTESFIIVDESRIELYSDEANEFRKFKIQLWYPAETTEGYDPVPWLEDGLPIARGLSRDIGLPFFVLDHTADILSNAYFKAPLSQDLDVYPVVIISHGWRGFRNLHTDLAEELASNGFIVVAIDHTYGSVATVLDDKVVYLNSEALPQREETPDFLEYANRLVNTYASDITATIDFLEEMNLDSQSRFNQKIDLTTIGLMGHSTGGGASVSAALDDERIDAIIGFDAWVEPIESNKIEQGLEIPTLFLRSEAWEVGLNNAVLYSLIEYSNNPPLLYQIDGTTHTDFTMVYMYSPLTKYIGFSGDLEKEYLNDMLKSMMIDFFNHTLKNDSSSEVDFDIWEEVKEVSW